MNRTAIIILVVGIVISGGIFLSARVTPQSAGSGGQAVENSDIRDGVQYVTVRAKGGYSPRASQAVAGIPTKLVVKTDGTYDCSSALVIRSIGFKKVLAQTGEEVIDLGIPKAGETIQGLCSMGMYNFQIAFN